LEIVYKILIGLGALVALMFALLVLLTGKGDAMSGGGAIRTSFRGKASFDDFLSRMILGLGVAFMAIMVILDWLSHRLPTDSGLPPM
jgi:preprotein translocase subunit SecG